MNRGGCFGGKVKTHKPLQIKSMNKHTILYRDEKKKEQVWKTINEWPSTNYF